MIPGWLRNCIRTSSTTRCAARPTAMISRLENRNTTDAPMITPTRTFGWATFSANVLAALAGSADSTESRNEPNSAVAASTAVAIAMPLVIALVVLPIASRLVSACDVYAESLGVELANLARDYAKEQGYSFVGPVRMRFEGVPDMTTGTFRIRSGVIRGSTIEGGEIRLPASDLPRTQGRGFPGHPRLLVSGPGAPGDPAGGDQHTYELQGPVTLLGRGTDCDLRLVDPGVSRHHAELRVENDQVVLVDLSSTNGTFVNGQPIRRVALTDGTHVSLGRTTLIFRQDGQDREDGQGTAYSRTSY